MKLTKPLIMAALVASGLLAGSLPLSAQNATNPPPAGAPHGPRGGPRPGGPTLERLTKALDLTDEQKPKVKAILEERDKKLQDFRKDAAQLSREERRTKLQAIHKETTEKLKAVLTEEQFKKFEQMTQRPRRARGGDAPQN